MRQFLATLSAGSTSCALHVPAQYVVPAFPTSVGRAPQAISSGASDHSSKLDRQAAWAATETIGDALERWFNLLGGPGYGLYGGSFKVSGAYYSYDPLVLRFKLARFVPNLNVAGTAMWNRTTSLLKATLSLTGPHGPTGNCRSRLQMPAPFSAHG